MSDHEHIAQVAHQKLVNERIVFFIANRSFAHFFAKNERFAQKTDERIPSPAADIYRFRRLSFLPFVSSNDFALDVCNYDVSCYDICQCIAQIGLKKNES